MNDASSPSPTESGIVVAVVVAVVVAAVVDTLEKLALRRLAPLFHMSFPHLGFNQIPSLLCSHGFFFNNFSAVTEAVANRSISQTCLKLSNANHF